VETMLDSVTVRVILGRSLELSCISLLLVATRNDTTPKKNDREALKWLRCQASFVSVIVHDLVLTGNGKISSVDHSL